MTLCAAKPQESSAREGEDVENQTRTYPKDIAGKMELWER